MVKWMQQLGAVMEWLNEVVVLDEGVGLCWNEIERKVWRFRMSGGNEMLERVGEKKYE